MNREEFAHGLRAVLQHIGPTKRHLDFVGLKGNLLFATDGYTIGIVAVSGDDFLIDRDQFDPDAEVFLPSKEAQDMLRFVRPDRARDRDMRVELLVAPSQSYDPTAPLSGEIPEAADYGGTHELHVGIRPEDPNSDDITSEVYSLYPSDYPTLSFDQLWSELQAIREQMFFSEEFVMQAGLVARFKAAEREFGDRMRLRPAAPKQNHHGQRALVTVGSNFLGAIAGLGEPSVNNEIPFGDSTLEEWCL